VKKVIAMLLLAGFLCVNVVGCGGTTKTSGAGGGGSTTEKGGGKDKSTK
jgi:hypothetical protein